MIKSENIVIFEHPLIQHKISLLRDKATGTNEFRKLVDEIAMLEGFEALSDLPVEDVEIETPIEKCKTPMIAGRKLAVVPILRAGLGMVSGILALVPNAKVGHIGMYRDEETHQPQEYYCKLPDPIEERLIVVCDPMLATGGSAVDAIDQIKKHGGKNIKFMCIIAAPEGLEKLHKAHPDVQIYVGHLDRQLNEDAYICPGLGDAGDRGAGAGELVLLELDDLLLDLHGDGNDLIVKTAGSLSSLGLLLGGSAEGVELFAGDTPNIADVLGGGAHVVVVERIPQAVLDHGVDKLLVAHAGAPAGVGSGIRSGAHVLGAAADDDIGIAGEDGAASLNDGLHTGAADHAHGVSGNGIGDTGLDGHLAGNVLALGSGQDAAEHQLIHVLRSDICALQSFLDHDGAHVNSGGVLQGAAKGADGGTAAVDNVQILHDSSS